jgi:hypothetical protein
MLTYMHYGREMTYMYSFGSDAMETGSLLGSINFFNIDGIKNGSNAVGAFVAKNRRSKCIISSIVDNQIGLGEWR